ncbi:gamma-secretase-activating protein isoform X8 [Marmota marmota marmota]|uniref:gamma-secretase-activating protein isoform X8 n=1 Tax=Marmota marmota marmota TaxID=9994 RepID=UPI00209353D2|nr:gamma-secretase-activating protein isoform X8 [Marmota marmota marmota]
MALRLVADFDLRKDVLPWLRAQRAASAAPGAEDVLETNYESLRVLNVERNGNIIYNYKDDERNIVFGLYDCQTRKNQHLYTFEKDLQVVSCSVNREKTLLAASLVKSTEEGRRNELQPGSKCLTLLVEIHPVNNVKVLKAVDSYIWVQFLYLHVESHPLPQNQLLLISEEKYIEQFHIQVTQEDGNRVVIKNSDHLPRHRIAEDFVWTQWDMTEQRLYYIDLEKSRSILKCLQFYADQSCDLMFEAPLDITLSDSGFKLINFGYDYRQDQEKLCKYLTLCVFTNHTERYVAVYLPGHFFHLLNIQHPDLICHSLFLTENNKTNDMLPHSSFQSLSGSLVLDWYSGRLYRAFLDQSYLLRFLWNTSLDCEKMAILHCVLSCGQDPQFLEGQIIQWISENVSACHSFDLIQEFIIASSYWSIYAKTSNVDTILPYSSVLTWNTEIPGITLVTEEIELPLMKVHSFKGYWEKLNSNLDYVKYAKPYLCYNNSVVKREWHNLISEEKTGKRRSTAYMRNILDSAKRVISNIEARNSEPRLTLLLQEEDNHQKLLLGLMVSELREHLLRHLQGVEKKKIEQMVLDYVSKLLDLICHLVETCWRRHDLQSSVLHFNRPRSAAEFEVFHIMTRILEATNSLFLPLPPGFHTLHTILGVHCLPLHNLLDYIDNGVLLLTETAVTRLIKDLDNSEKNEKLKFSILVRLPPLIGQKICRVWDHPMSSNIISRTHVTQLLQNYKKQSRNSMMDKSSFSVEFLPLNYFIEILTDLESSSQGSQDAQRDLGLFFHHSCLVPSLVACHRNVRGRPEEANRTSQELR